MVTKWVINIQITDLSNKYDAATLVEEIKANWLPVRFDLKLDRLKVELGREGNLLELSNRQNIRSST